MKKKESSTWKPVRIILFAMFVIATILITSINEDKINNLQEEIYNLQGEIDSMPHYECWNETTIDRINFSRVENGRPIDINFYYGLEKSVEHIVCQDGVRSTSINGHITGYINTQNETKFCLVEKVKEVCTLNRDVILGVKE